MAARRVVSVSRKNNGLTCPTDDLSQVENKAEFPVLSNRKFASSFGQIINPNHKRMSRTLGYCLTLGSFDAWSKFTTVAALRLTDTERAALAYAALKSLSPDHAELTAATVLESEGMPLPAFLGGMDEARSWATCASRNELKAYALAAFEEMTSSDQAAFFRHISEMEIAA